MVSLYILFAVILGLIIFFASITRVKGFKNLKIYREINQDIIREGEPFNITTVIENRKNFPIAFLAISEKIYGGLNYSGERVCIDNENEIWHTSRYRIGRFQRIKRTYQLTGRRGAYLLRNMKVVLGDSFGFNVETREIEDPIEILIYPRVEPIQKFTFDITNFNGDTSVTRWIYKDPLYIKGIREYNIEDRMKDIHWKSSLKMNKLMVREYDYTSQREVIIILNVQCHEKPWIAINREYIERAIRISIALAHKSINERMPIGMWTNAQVISYNEEFPDKVKPGLNSLKKIMEICARIDYSTKTELIEYLKNNQKIFDERSTYILVTSFLDEKSKKFILDLKKSRFNIKIIDVSDDESVENINGIEKIAFKGGI